MTEKKVDGLWSLPGIFSWPYFAKADEGREASDGAYKVDLYIPKVLPAFLEKAGWKKEEWNKKLKEMEDIVLSVGKKEFGDDFKKEKLQGNPYHCSFKLGDNEKAYDPRLKDCFILRVKSPAKRDKGIYVPGSARKPKVYGPSKVNGAFPELSQEEIAKIKGGDWGLVNYSPYAYSNKSKGVSCGLNAVQFARSGDVLDPRSSKMLSSMEELPIDLESIQDASATVI